jgi:hypothetical protein
LAVTATDMIARVTANKRGLLMMISNLGLVGVNQATTRRSRSAQRCPSRRCVYDLALDKAKWPERDGLIGRSNRVIRHGHPLIPGNKRRTLGRLANAVQIDRLRRSSCDIGRRIGRNDRLAQSPDQLRA